MNTFAVEIFDDTGAQCTFYTVRWEDSELGETDKFFRKFENNSKLAASLQELAKFLSVVIADEYGANANFFRFENEAHALPPFGKFQVGEIQISYSNFPLRLYCLRLTDGLVILFNGDEKTAATAQKGKTSMVFHEANLFAKRITEALYDTLFIQMDNRTLLNENNQTDITI